MMRPGIEPRSPGSLAKTLPTTYTQKHPATATLKHTQLHIYIYIYIYIYIFMDTLVV